MNVKGGVVKACFSSKKVLNNFPQSRKERKALKFNLLTLCGLSVLA